MTLRGLLISVLTSAAFPPGDRPTMRPTIRILVAAAALALGGCESLTGPGLPRIIFVCEVYSSSFSMCGTWTRQAGGYLAEWEDGVVSTIEVESFSAERVHFTRTRARGSDLETTISYVGTVSDNQVRNGVMTMTSRSASFTFSWTADW